jgi:hypothetical protein
MNLEGPFGNELVHKQRMGLSWDFYMSPRSKAQNIYHVSEEHGGVCTV